MTAGENRTSRLLRVGIVGSLVAALCCFTPMLTFLLTAAGAAAVIGYLDDMLLPALAVFGAITLYALERRRRAAAACCPPEHS